MKHILRSYASFVLLAHLLSLDLILDLRYFDLHGVDLLVLDQRDRCGLAVLDGLEGQISQWNVPLTVILLPFPVGGQEARDTF